MNDETPHLHGFPVRLIVPGWDGTSWVKWLTRLTATAGRNKGFHMNPAYTYPKYLWRRPCRRDRPTWN
jgi:DMSO/TMAO reductase YedYZ molybdopterin-dependent catalytic subunit